MRTFLVGTWMLILTSTGMLVAIGIFNVTPGWWIFVPVVLGGILQLIGFWLIRPRKLTLNYPHLTSSTNKIRITVLTVTGKPTFIVDGNVSAESINAVVKMAHGTQPSGSPHNWRGDPVEA